MKLPVADVLRRRLREPAVLGELLVGQPADRQLRRSELERHPGVERLVDVDRP